jgi:hypothetical protein
MIDGFGKVRSDTMSTREVTPDEILEGLRALQPDRWPEVLDFIGYLRSTSVHATSHQQELTAHELLQSSLVGLWADRDDIDDNLSFARRLREQAERRQGSDSDPA